MRPYTYGRTPGAYVHDAQANVHKLIRKTVTNAPLALTSRYLQFNNDMNFPVFVAHTYTPSVM